MEVVAGALGVEVLLAPTWALAVALPSLLGVLPKLLEGSAREKPS